MGDITEGQLQALIAKAVKDSIAEIRPYTNTELRNKEIEAREARHTKNKQEEESRKAEEKSKRDKIFEHKEPKPLVTNETSVVNTNTPTAVVNSDVRAGDKGRAARANAAWEIPLCPPNGTYVFLGSGPDNMWWEKLEDCD